MVKWIFILSAVALIAAVLGFAGIANLAANGALFLIVVLVVGIALAFLVGVMIFRWGVLNLVDIAV